MHLKILTTSTFVIITQISANIAPVVRRIAMPPMTTVSEQDSVHEIGIIITEIKTVVNTVMRFYPEYERVYNIRAEGIKFSWLEHE